MDPHEVLNLPRYGFTHEQLRSNYKLIAMQLHPDKRPPSMTHAQATEAFQELTNAYRMLKAELEGRGVPDRPFNELKKGAAEAAAESSAADPPPVSSSFNINRFNNVFDSNRVSDPVQDTGYEAWMRANDPDQVRSSVSRERKAVTTYVEPVPFVISQRGLVAFSELGVTGVDDYSRAEVARRSVQYTDYRLAHTTSKLLENEAELVEAAEQRARRELRSVDALKAHREVPCVISREEEDAIAARAAEAEHAEARRRDALYARDCLFQQTHERMTQLMLAR